jgi:tetratricopeptide (TPR) repeat protein
MLPLNDAAGASPRERGLGDAAAKTEKADWYREVLALEPGSRVFFPFARLLAELGRTDEAIAALRRGLALHPEFIEARLLLVDMLHKSGDSAACGSEVARLAGLFQEYPGFWEAWSDMAATAGQRRELSASLGLLGALLRDAGITLADVLVAGLKHLRDASGRESFPSPVSPETETRPETCGTHPSPPFVFGGTGFSVPPALSRSEPGEEAAPAGGEAGGEVKSSLRTRSMAEVLAEQGDLRGAVDIYEELLAAGGPEDRPALLERLEHLKARLGEEGMPDHVPPSPAPPAPAPAKPPHGAAFAREMLEKLALRLETKARH